MYKRRLWRERKKFLINKHPHLKCIFSHNFHKVCCLFCHQLSNEPLTYLRKFDNLWVKRHIEMPTHSKKTFPQIQEITQQDKYSSSTRGILLKGTQYFGWTWIWKRTELNVSQSTSIRLMILNQNPYKIWPVMSRWWCGSHFTK